MIETKTEKLFHVAVVLSFLHSPISLAENFEVILYFWLILLQILCILAAFSVCGPLLIVPFNKKKDNFGSRKT